MAALGVLYSVSSSRLLAKEEKGVTWSGSLGVLVFGHNNAPEGAVHACSIVRVWRSSQ